MKKVDKRSPPKVKLLSSGNPQIEKGDGDAVVQSYIQAMPGWKQAIGKELDSIATKTIPKVQKAVRWNTPFYGTEKFSWFFGFYCYQKYIQVFFLNGANLKPLLPGESKQKDVRYLKIYENDELDTVLLEKWLKQGSKIPGNKLF